MSSQDSGACRISLDPPAMPLQEPTLGPSRDKVESSIPPLKGAPSSSSSSSSSSSPPPPPSFSFPSAPTLSKRPVTSESERSSERKGPPALIPIHPQKQPKLPSESEVASRPNPSIPYMRPSLTLCLQWRKEYFLPFGVIKFGEPMPYYRSEREKPWHVPSVLAIFPSVPRRIELFVTDNDHPEYHFSEDFMHYVSFKRHEHILLSGFEMRLKKHKKINLDRLGHHRFSEGGLKLQLYYIFDFLDMTARYVMKLPLHIVRNQRRTTFHKTRGGSRNVGSRDVDYYRSELEGSVSNSPRLAIPVLVSSPADSEPPVTESSSQP